MRELVEKMKKTQILEPSITLRSSLKEEQLSALEALADAIAQSL